MEYHAIAFSLSILNHPCVCEMRVTLFCGLFPGFAHIYTCVNVCLWFYGQEHLGNTQWSIRPQRTMLIFQLEVPHLEASLFLCDTLDNKTLMNGFTLNQVPLAGRQFREVYVLGE